MLNEDMPLFEVNVFFGEPVQFADPQAGSQQDHNIIIVIIVPILADKLQIGLLLGFC